MLDTLLVVGTASHSGKSTIVAGLCRLAARRGIAVAPFKAQNMSNNARAVAGPDGWGEIGVSQYVQAQAARVTPSTDMNPVLLKPRGDGESQLVIHGQAVGNYRAGDYYGSHWGRALEAVKDSYKRMGKQFDLLIGEGAGSIAEINLQHRDLANVEFARMANARIVIVVDIERGGAFASLYGTIELLPPDIREKVVGAVINKFRGDLTLLEPGIDQIEKMTGVPILGVVPYANIMLPSEDSVSLPGIGEEITWGRGDGVPEKHSVTVAVPRLPRISNFTDLEPLSREPGVRVRFCTLDSGLEFADAVVIPGTKNTVDDLRALRESGFDKVLKGFDGYVVGICGGYQIIGERILNADIEGTDEEIVKIDGVGLLPVQTVFSPSKHVEAVTKKLSGTGPLSGISGDVSGYEIHMGETDTSRVSSHPLGRDSAASGRVLGTYLHGLFENKIAREGFVHNLFKLAGKEEPVLEREDRSPYEEVADLLADNLDLGVIFP